MHILHNIIILFLFGFVLYLINNSLLLNNNFVFKTWKQVLIETEREQEGYAYIAYLSWLSFSFFFYPLWFYVGSMGKLQFCPQFA